MGKITFKCKGMLSDDKPCDKRVSTKMHTGVAEIFEGIQDLVSNVDGNTLKRDSKGVAKIPADWEFTLICSRGHEDDYSYEDRE